MPNSSTSTKQPNRLGPFQVKSSFLFVPEIKLLNAYVWLHFWNVYHRKVVYKNVNRIGQRLQNLDTLLVLIVFLCGVFQALKPMSYKWPFLENLPVFQNSVIQKNWKTFYLSDLYPVIFSPSNYLSIEKFNLSDNRLSIVMSPFWNMYQNPIYFGIFPPNNSNTLPLYSFSNYFDKKQCWVFINNQDSLIFDAVPSHMESCWMQNPKFRLFPIYEKNSTNLSTTQFYPVDNNFKISPSPIFDENESKLILDSKQVDDNNLNNFFDIDPVDQPVCYQLRRFSRKLKRKYRLVQNYRNIFYRERLFPMELNTSISLKKNSASRLKSKKKNWLSNLKIKNLFARRPSRRWNQIKLEICEDGDPLQILKRVKTRIFRKTLRTLRPRFLSGYRFPDTNTAKLQRTNLTPILPPNLLKEREVLSVFFPSKYRQILVNTFFEANQNLASEQSTDQKIDFVFNLPNSLIGNSTQKLPSRTKYHKKLVFYKDGINMYRLPKDFNKTYFFHHTKFQDIREPIQTQSWLAFAQVGIVVIGFKILQHIYQEYGKEIVFSLIDCIKLIGVIQDDEWVKQELELGSSDKGFKSVRKVKKSLQNMTGIGALKPQMNEMITFLKTRSSYLARILDPFKDPDQIPRSLESRSILLIGPPGTGKTLFVQAIVGEADAPVLAQSGNVLKDYKERGRGARSIQNLFKRARQVSPCVVFIDEIDNIGVKRQFLSLNSTGETDGIDLLELATTKYLPSDDLSKISPKTDIKSLPDPDDKFNHDDIINFWKPYTEASQTDSINSKVLQELQDEQQRKGEQLGMLTQLLMELDGLHPLNDIIVIGATNRPQVLDPALLRSGRFHKIIKLDLPNHSKRIELLKFYSEKIGIQGPLPWHYLSQRIIGLSAADIATIMNTSALAAVTFNSQHSLQSIEESIERVISYTLPKNSLKFKYPIYYFSSRIKLQYSKNKLFSEYRLMNKILANKDKLEKNLTKARSSAKRFRHIVFPQLKRLSYYQVGKSIIHLSLSSSSAGVYLTLQERQKNFRYMLLNGIVVNAMETFHFRFELEEKLAGLLAGKASEVFLCCSSLGLHIKGLSKMNFFNPSSLGEDEMKFATLLSFLMVERWYFYAQVVCTQNHHPILESSNLQELSPDEIKLFKAFFEETRKEIIRQNRLTFSNQKWSFRTWWIKQIYDEEHLFDRSFMEWYRIYLPDPEETEQSIEWRPPDDFYLMPKTKSIQGFIYWNSFLKLTSYYIYHGLVLNAFNSAFSFLTNKRELLDYLVDFLLRSDKVRSYQIQILMVKFLSSIDRSSESVIYPVLDTSPSFKTVAKSWGPRSRRKTERFLDFEYLKTHDTSIPRKQKEGEKSESFQKLKISKSLLHLFKDRD